jgi:hypothetical protein
MTRKGSLGVLCVLAVAIGAAYSASALTPQNAPGPTDGPSDGGCYCNVPLCGCSSPGPNFDLTATCTCGATCTRSCTYTSKRGS